MTDRPTSDDLVAMIERMLLAFPITGYDFVGVRDEANTLVQAYRGRSDEAAEAFKLKAERVGADPAWYWRLITANRNINGKISTGTYRVVDIATNRPKNCMVIVSRRGKRSYTSVKWVASHLGAPRTRTRAMVV